ncbi:MAG: MgtC/SapB family protein [Ruminococcaceae bacterium]|nr:MgtC/SapB family protein [Oscillospiraceae bacterium]
MITDPIANLLGLWAGELNVCSIMLRIALSFVLSTVIGCERSSKRHSAGLRTFISVTLAATVIMMLETYLSYGSEVKLYLLSSASVIAIAIISVHSLLISSRSQIKGLTTSVALWACGILGLSTGAGYYTVTLMSFAVLLFCLSVLPALERHLKNRSNHFEIHLELKSSGYLQNFVGTIRRLGLTINGIEANPAYADSGLSVYMIAFSISSKELKKYKTHSEIIEALRSLDYIYHIEEMCI